MTAELSPRRTFRREDRIRKRSEYEICHAQGKRYHSGRFVVVFLQTHQPARLGLVVGRQTGGAVIRNRWKRVIRDWFRLDGRRLSPTGDHVVMVRRSVKGKPDASVREELGRLFGKAGHP